MQITNQQRLEQTKEWIKGMRLARQNKRSRLIEKRRNKIPNKIDNIVRLKNFCPIDITKVYRYSEEFQIDVDFDPYDMNLAKEDLANASKNLILMMLAAIQPLADRKIKETGTDKKIYDELVSNIRKMLKYIESKKNSALRFEKNDRGMRVVGFPYLTNFATFMETIHDAFLETFYRATEEYHAFQEKGELKRKPKAFLHILLDLFSITMNFLGIGEETDVHQYQKGAIQIGGQQSSGWQKTYQESISQEPEGEPEEKDKKTEPASYTESEVQLEDVLGGQDG